jgi:hypothetical protein
MSQEHLAKALTVSGGLELMDSPMDKVHASVAYGRIRQKHSLRLLRDASEVPRVSWVPAGMASWATFDSPGRQIVAAAPRARRRCSRLRPARRGGGPCSCS